MLAVILGMSLSPQLLGQSPAEMMHLVAPPPSVAQDGPSAGSIGDPIEYRYHDKSTLALGRGFSPVDVTAPKRACISFKPSDEVEQVVNPDRLA